MKLTIALPKGRLGDLSWDYLLRPLKNPFDERKLSFENEMYQVLWVKPSDVITYVMAGIADIGIVGQDTLDESDPDVYRLKELPFGACQLVLAGFERTDTALKEGLKVATKYPNLTKKYFKSKQQRFTLLPLQGSVELAPVVGLSDVVVDIVETGSTLKANGLIILDVIQDSKAIVFANKARYRFQLEAIESLLLKAERNSHA
jgi:ATP phosphoribosyltransferase